MSNKHKEDNENNSKFNKIAFKKAKGCELNVKNIENINLTTKNIAVSNNINTNTLNSNIITTQVETINNVSLDAVMNSLNGFKKAIYDNYYLLSLVNKYKDLIIDEGRYDTVLQPIVEKSYLENLDYFWIESSPLNDIEFESAMYYYTWELYKELNNTLVKNISNVNIKNLETEVHKFNTIKYGFNKMGNSNKNRGQLIKMDLWNFIKR